MTSVSMTAKLCSAVPMVKTIEHATVKATRRRVVRVGVSVDVMRATLAVGEGRVGVPGSRLRAGLYFPEVRRGDVSRETSRGRNRTDGEPRDENTGVQA